MSVRRENSKRILVCIPEDLLKKVERLQKKYKSRSELIREAIELLVASHHRETIEKEFKEGFRILKNLNKDFAEKSLFLDKEDQKD